MVLTTFSSCFFFCGVGLISQFKCFGYSVEHVVGFCFGLKTFNKFTLLHLAGRKRSPVSKMKCWISVTVCIFCLTGVAVSYFHTDLNPASCILKSTV